MTNLKLIWNNLYNSLRLPTPIELGRSIHNSLPVKRSARDDTEVYSYQEYYQELKRQFPVRLFLYFTLPYFLGKIKVWFKKLFYNLFNLFKPKSYLLDLRIFDSEKDFYKSGTLSADKRLVYANFKILEEFVETELNNKSLLEHKKLGEQYPNLNYFDKQWYEDIQQIQDIYSYWKYTRYVAWYDTRKIYELYGQAIAANNFILSQKLLEDYHKSQNREVDLETFWLKKLINCRFGLWKI